MNINKLMKQAQDMQKKMQDMQDKLGDIIVEGSAGGGLVKAKVTGKGDVKQVFIDKSLLGQADDDSAETLADLVVAAFNDAKRKAEDSAAEEMKKITGGMNLPAGMKLPF